MVASTGDIVHNHVDKHRSHLLLWKCGVMASIPPLLTMVQVSIFAYSLLYQNKNERTLFVKTRKPLTHLLQYTTYSVPYHLFYIDKIKLILMLWYDTPCMVTGYAIPSSIPGIFHWNLEHGFTEHTSRFLSLWIMKNGAIGTKICIKLRMTVWWLFCAGKG